MSEPVGIIYPPPDLRGIVDSTAKYVAKNGGAFEQRIMRDHKDKPKFRFLFSDDPFNAYYRHKVKEIKASLLGDNSESSDATKEQKQQDNEQQQDTDSRDAATDDTSQSRLSPKTTTTSENNSHSSDYNHDAAHDDRGDEAAPDSNEAISSDNNGGDQLQNNHETTENDPDNDGTTSRVRPKLNEYIQEMTMKLVEPPTLNHLATSAPSLTRLDCDIIKLSSQFIATHGRSFLLELVSREHNNSRFDFLKPQHGQFSFMTNLIMQYALIQNPPLDILEQLEKDATNQKHLLERIKMRAEWTKMLEMEKKRREEAEEREKLLYSQIDWHDFVIVETIDFRPDEQGKYPPTTADQVGTRLLLQQRTEDQVAAEEMEIDMDMDSGEEEEDSQGDDDRISSQQHDGDFVIPNPPDAAKVNIKRDYDPKASSNRQLPQPENYFVSPITNERIPVDKIHEHVRYNLSDPRYLEKKDQMLQERMNEETVFASGSQIQDSLKNLAERRTDIFGMNDAETAIGHRIGDENQGEKPKDDRLIWDGHKSSLKKKKLN